MLIFVMSLVILISVIVFVWIKPRGKIAVPIVLIGLGIAFTATGIAPLVTILQVVMLIISWLFWYQLSGKPKVFLAGSVVATVVAYIPWAIRLKDELHEHQQMVQKYPLESLDHRIPAAGLGDGGHNRGLPNDTLHNLESLEIILDNAKDQTERQRMNWLLKRLHEEKLDTFISSAGFGLERMAHHQVKYMDSYEKEFAKETITQPESPFSTPWDVKDAYSVSERSSVQSFRSFHQSRIAEFANPSRFGYIQSPRRAAGFLPHRFYYPPNLEDYTVRRLELIGILKHDKPVVYMTENLPSMTEAVKAPTRNLDEFEAAALVRLRKGDDLIVAEGPGGLRMVGSIRLAKQCADCHSGQRGDLLGAFTYVLKPAK